MIKIEMTRTMGERLLEVFTKNAEVELDLMIIEEICIGLGVNYKDYWASYGKEIQASKKLTDTNQG